MNKKLLSVLVAALALPCFADEVPSLNISQNDAESKIELSGILSIKYTDTDMVVSMKDGTQSSFPLDEIVMIEFGRMASAIRTLLADECGDGSYAIIDLQGKVVAKGNVNANGTVALPVAKGVYMLSVGNKTKKILVK